MAWCVFWLLVKCFSKRDDFLWSILFVSVLVAYFVFLTCFLAWVAIVSDPEIQFWIWTRKGWKLCHCRWGVCARWHYMRRLNREGFHINACTPLDSLIYFIRHCPFCIFCFSYTLPCVSWYRARTRFLIMTRRVVHGGWNTNVYEWSKAAREIRMEEWFQQLEDKLQWLDEKLVAIMQWLDALGVANRPRNRPSNHVKRNCAKGIAQNLPIIVYVIFLIEMNLKMTY